MRALIGVFVCICVFAGAHGLKAASRAGKYDADGRYPVSIDTLRVPSGNGSFAATAYIPGGRGPFPVVIFSSGFLQKGAAYSPYARRLASWGMIALLRDDPNILSDLGQGIGVQGGSEPAGGRNDTAATNGIVSDLVSEVDWLQREAAADPASPLYRKVERDRIGLAGHSRGAQAALLAAEQLHKRIKGVFVLDPVDLPLGPQARYGLKNLGVPLVMLGETTNSSPLSCAPSSYNYQMLFRYAASGTVMMTAAGADHTMFEDAASCSFCWLCSKGTADAQEVLSFSVRYLTAFFARELLKDWRVGARFEGAGVPADVETGRIEISVK